jgi:hypothetical protein
MVYFRAMLCILLSFGRCLHFGIFHQEKSGNPGTVSISGSVTRDQKQTVLQRNYEI